jgi:hypothetical protein
VQQATEAAEAAPVIQTPTLAELGPRLPIGIVGTDEAVHRDLECKEWRGREEREVEKLKRKTRQKGDFISRLLGYMFTRVGPYDFASMTPAEVQRAISKLWRADAMYLYLWLRHECIGPDLDLELTCRHCGFRIAWRGDLRTLEIKTTAEPTALEWDYECNRPFELRGTTVQRMRLRPSRWHLFEELARKAVVEGDTGVVSVDLIRECIVALNGETESRPLVAADLDLMTKRDLEALSAEIDRRELGPDLSVTETCPRCSLQFQTSLDWGYASFFAISSRSTGGG